jgi:hypothetical protein
MGKALAALAAMFGLVGLGAVVFAIVWTLFAWSGRQLDRANDNKGLLVIRSGRVISAAAAQSAPFGPADAQKPTGPSTAKVLTIKNGKVVQPGSTDRKLGTPMKKVPCKHSTVEQCYHLKPAGLSL